MIKSVGIAWSIQKLNSKFQLLYNEILIYQQLYLNLRKHRLTIGIVYGNVNLHASILVYERASMNYINYLYLGMCRQVNCKLTPKISSFYKQVLH